MTNNLIIDPNKMSPLTILLVEDNPADARLIEEFLKDSGMDNVLHVAHDGITAMNFLHKNCKHEDTKLCPHIVILDLNLPLMSGHEVLKEIKTDNDLKSIPVLILTTSTATEDVEKCYKCYANCYILKPVDFNEFARVMGSIKDFWFKKAELPP